MPESVIPPVVAVAVKLPPTVLLAKSTAIALTIVAFPVGPVVTKEIEPVTFN